MTTPFHKHMFEAAFLIGAGTLAGSVTTATAQPSGIDEQAEDDGEAAEELAQEGTEAVRAGVEEVDQRTVTVIAGLGFEGYLATQVRGAVGTAFLWDVRASIPIHDAVSIEAAYVGSGASIDSPLGDESAMLLGTTFEASGVWRAGERPIQPFAFAGLGWRHVSVVGQDFTTADHGITDSDNMVVIPLGGGVSYRRDGYYADARVTLRLASGADLVQMDPSRDAAGAMHAFAMTVRAGVEL